jgi:hypothetical protein
MYSDGDGHMPKWLKWVIGGALIVLAVALTIATAGLGGAIAAGLGGSFAASVAGGANIANALGTALGNYQNAYNLYIAAMATYSFVNGLAKISYFGLENVISNLIGLWF